MTVNNYVKQWCDEDYDVNKEDFYVSNAYYIADREWAVSAFKHGIFALLVAVGTVLFSNNPNVFNNIIMAISNLGILTICFWFYGIRNYNANSIETSVGIYVMVAILLFITRAKLPTFCNVIFSIASIPFYIYLTFVMPCKFLKIARIMKKKIIADEQEEEETSKQSYHQWTNSYNASRYGLPSSDEQQSQQMLQARQLFDGYATNKQMLKTRYRQLAKQYHPDKGGNTVLFQCIVAVYEELGVGLK